jgi:membrane-bound lytic murein transglycosylase D
MTPKDALCFAATAVLLSFPGAVLADGALIATPPAVARPSALPAPLSAALLPSVVAAPVEVVSPAEDDSARANGEPAIEAAADGSAPGADEDLWDRIRAGFAMEEVDSALVLRHEAWYLNRPEYVDRMIDRSRRYLYHIVEEVEKRGMPMEIALLPMIESAYNPAAYSRARAAGMWQFIPSTGRKYGLQQTWWYDGRRDVLAATRAALDYLQFLHRMFGDWELALAAYNCGEGSVQRAIAKNRRNGKPTDYMHLKLPQETRNYLPKLQAVKNIVADPELFKIVLEPLPSRPYFAVVTAPPHIDVVMAAKLAGVPEEEFRYLNPGHQRPVITPVANRQLLVPADKVDQFHANLESNDQPLVTWQTYQLKNNEKLDAVARKFDISIERLKEVNGLSGRKRLRPGQMLLVPMEHDDAATNLDETYLSSDFKAPIDDYHKRTVYRVKSGDTLSSIARRYGTSVDKLKAWNGLRANTVRAGQRLTIWQQGAPGRKVASRVRP